MRLRLVLFISVCVAGVLLSSAGTLRANDPVTLENFSYIQWTEVTPHPIVVNEAQAVALNNKLYSFGGFVPNSGTPTRQSFVYDPQLDPKVNTALPPTSEPWQALAPLTSGLTHSGIATDGTDIYLAGGYIEKAGGGQNFGTNKAWRYNVAANTYTALPNFSKAVSAGQLVYLNGKLHYIGGTSPNRQTDLTDHFVLDLNDLGAGWQTKAPLPTVLNGEGIASGRHHAGTAVVDGYLYFIGGQTDHDGELDAHRQVDRYDPITDTWTTVAPLPPPTDEGRNHIMSTTLEYYGRIFVLGGQRHHNSGRQTILVYNPDDNTWVNWGQVLPHSRRSAIAGILNNEFYISSGLATDGMEGRKTYRGVPVLLPQPQLTATGAAGTATARYNQTQTAFAPTAAAQTATAAATQTAAAAETATRVARNNETATAAAIQTQDAATTATQSRLNQEATSAAETATRAARNNETATAAVQQTLTAIALTGTPAVETATAAANQTATGVAAAAQTQTALAPTPSPTDTPFIPTLTPRFTATPVTPDPGDGQMAANGGFELGNTSWKLQRAKIKCQPNKAFTGSCALLLKAGSKAVQKFDAALPIGTRLALSAYVNAKKAKPGAVVNVTLLPSKEKIRLRLASRNTNGYQLHSEPVYIVQSGAQAVKIVMNYKGKKGKVWVDDLSLIVTLPAEVESLLMP